MAEPQIVRIKRIYEPAAGGDGFRVLVDRLWPRGVKREDAHVDLWAKTVAPTTDLRKWFGHDPARFDAFRSRCLAELDDNVEVLQDVIQRAGEADITLLYAARDPVFNHAVVLLGVLAELRQGR